MHKLVWLAILVYIVAMGTITSLRHYNFQTQAGDMAIFVQTVWNTLHGRPMINTFEEVPNTLGVHFSPILYLFVPFYYIFTSPYILLWLQTIFIALGAYPLYRLAQKNLNDDKLSAIVALGYLLYPGLHWLNFYDFHPVSFLPPLILFTLYFAEMEKWFWAALFFIITLSSREDSILIALFSAIYLLTKKDWRMDRKKFWIAAGAALACLIYFIVATKILMPHFGGGLLRLDRYAHLGGSIGEIAKNAVIHPDLFLKTALTGEKISYIFWALFPVAFLPIFSWRGLLLILPGFAENLLTNYTAQFSGLYQYDATIVAGIFIGAIEGVLALRGASLRVKNHLPQILLVTTLIAFLFRSPLKPIGFPIALFGSSEHWDNLRRIVKMVPPDISLAVYTNLAPHLAHREKIYNLNQEPKPVDWVIIDGADYFLFENPEKLQAYVDRYMFSGLYTMEVINDRYFILKKKVVLR